MKGEGQKISIGLLGASIEIADPVTTEGIMLQMLAQERLLEIERRILALEGKEEK